MKSVPLTTKVLVVLLVAVGARFFYILSSKCSESSKVEVLSQSAVEDILTCQEYTDQIKNCTSEAMICLKDIAESKKFH